MFGSIKNISQRKTIFSQHKKYDLGYVCFGVKPFQETILHSSVCLVAHGKYGQTKKSFPLTVKYPPHTRKSFYTFILPTNNFQKISLLTHSHHSRQAQAEGWRELSPVKPRSSPRPTALPV